MTASPSEGGGSPKRARSAAAQACEAAMRRFRSAAAAERARAAARSDWLVHGQPLDCVVRSVSPHRAPQGGTLAGTEELLSLWRRAAAHEARVEAERLGDA
jgi:hypothetical protein